MTKTIISEGKTTNEAIENGLKELKVTKNMVDIKVLENEDKRSFFDILAPRVVKVELTVKENSVEISKETVVRERREMPVATEQELELAKKKAEEFLKELLKNISDKEFSYSIDIKDGQVKIEISGEDAGILIGYRGDVLNSLQVIITSVVNKNIESRIRVLLDIEGYREKREKVLEELAVKVSKTVLKQGKPITLEPMTAYERKIIHSKLQENNEITTYSVGEEPNRKIVIARK